ncbi:MAG: guanine deaminase [Myxococcota bacterium]|nr:guanine deaminase [Myxococcota bacterium]
MSVTLHTGSFLHAPRGEAEGMALAALAVEAGRIVAFDSQAKLSERYPEALCIAHPGLIVPGFVDAHVHFPQLAMAGAHGESLLDWLDRYTFPAELEFANARHAQTRARQFVGMLRRAGTTNAMIFGVSFPKAMRALFETLNEAGMGGATGLVWMNQEGPDGLLSSTEECRAASEALLSEFCSVGSLRYAVLPRFVPSCSPKMLQAAGDFLQAHPDLLLQSHLSESLDEVKWVQQLYPKATDYTDVYEQFGLLGRRSSYAHGIHLSDKELQRLSATKTRLVHCPSANLYLGSGLFDYRRAKSAGVEVALGSDVGAGTSLCLLDVLRDFYGVQMVQGNRLSVGEMLHLATQAGADLLGMTDETGSFEPGKRADFVALRPKWDDLFAARWAQCSSMEEQFFAAAMLGGTSAIASTTIAGQTTVHPG